MPSHRPSVFAGLFAAIFGIAGPSLAQTDPDPRSASQQRDDWRRACERTAIERARAGGPRFNPRECMNPPQFEELQPNGVAAGLPSRAALLLQPGVDNVGITTGRLIACLQNARYPTDARIPRQVDFTAIAQTEYTISTTINGSPVRLHMMGNEQAVYVDEIIMGDVYQRFEDKYSVLLILYRPCMGSAGQARPSASRAAPPPLPAANPAPTTLTLSAERTNAEALLRLADSANRQCRGGSGDDEATEAACEARDIYFQRLNKLDWCYGKQGEIGAENAWHKCGPTSLR